MVGEESAQNIVQDVRSRDNQRQFFQQSFEVFLGALLAVEADAVMDRRFAAEALFCQGEVFLGFAHPLPRCPFHRGLFPWT